MRKFEVGDVVRFKKDFYDEYGCGQEVAVTYSSDGVVKLFGNEEKWDHQRLWDFVVIAEKFTPPADPINHPAHYAGSNGIECIDAMRSTLTPDEFRGYCKGAAFKYIWRERQKGGNESLAKAVWYLNEAQK